MATSNVKIVLQEPMPQLTNCGSVQMNCSHENINKKLNIFLKFIKVIWK